MPQSTSLHPDQILHRLQQWSQDLGFLGLSVSRVQLAEDDRRMQTWLAAGKYGEMEYLARHRELRRDPKQLHPQTLSIICVRLPYWPQAQAARSTLKDGRQAYVSRYALGRDYHKVLRGRLRQLARRLEDEIGPFGYRAFADSAPVLEKALARDASLGWIGKHTLLIDPDHGSYFFLGELFTDLPLPVSQKAAVDNRCGSCQACIRSCPTGAISEEGELDARRCISYLTIELKGTIPEEMRSAIGNRIFGCDDCQLVCPWNRDAAVTTIDDFKVRHQLDQSELLDLLNWSEEEFLKRSEGMAIRRAGYRSWQRNIVVALGNGPAEQEAIDALQTLRANRTDPLLREHIDWSLQRLNQQLSSSSRNR